MNRYEDINQIDLVLSMFNQYLFQDCKNNIDDLIYAYQTNMATCGNRLVELLLDSIKTYTLDSIGLPLFQSILGRCGKTGPESQQIINKIVEYKMYTKDQIEPMRKYVKDMIAKTYILRANDRYSDSPSDFINYLKGVNFKSTAVDYLTSTKFGDIDINSIKAEEQDQGIASSFEWINQTFRPECTYPRMGLFCVSMPPGCMAGDTEVFLADGTVETLENLHKSKKTNITVYACDGNDPKVSVAENCQISKYVNSWYVVEIDGKKEYRVTENHPFLLITGEWKRADELKDGDILMPFNCKPIKSGETSESCGNYVDVYTKDSRDRHKGHQLTKEYLCLLDPTINPDEVIAHHSGMVGGRFNRSDNSVESIKLMSDIEHKKYHVNFQKDNIGLDSFIEGGKNTRFTSTEVSDRNKMNWLDEDYRTKMIEVVKKNGKTTSAILNKNLDGYYGTKSKIFLALKFGKELISLYNLKNTAQLLEKWDENRRNENISCSSVRVPKRETIEKYFKDNIDKLYSDCISYNNHTVTKVYVETLETPQPVYDLVNVDIYHNYAVKFDETSGFFSHNTGKTLFCMQECLYMCLKGKKCHYLCMGDMTESDFIIRMAAQYFGIPFYEAKRNFDIVYAELKKVIGDRLEITCIPASVITVDEYIEFIKSKDYDVCFCDYDSQFKSNVYTESMYLTYGDIYAKLSELTIQYKKLVFILAQPMKASWSLPVIEIDQVGESARKIHAVDWCLTRGREPGNLNGLGISKIVKSRRGEEQVIDYNIRLNNGRFKSLPKAVYEDIKQVPEKKDYTEAEIDNMINNFLQARGQVQQSLNNKMGNSGPNRRGAAPF